MNLTRIIVPLVAASLLSTIASAETTVDRMQCGDWNIRVGDPVSDVTARCGEAEMEKDGNWYYHRDTNKIVILHIEDGKVSKITEEKTSHKGADQ